MIDFKNAAFLKLKPIPNVAMNDDIKAMFVDGETVVQTYKGVRDVVIFTTKRICSINVQGLTGKKKDYTSLPYSRIQAFSVETAGVLDLDSELEVWFSGLGKVKFEFVASADVAKICKFISSVVL